MRVAIERARDNGVDHAVEPRVVSVINGAEPFAALWKNRSLGTVVVDEKTLAPLFTPTSLLDPPVEEPPAPATASRKVSRYDSFRVFDVDVVFL